MLITLSLPVSKSVRKMVVNNIILCWSFQKHNCQGMLLYKICSFSIRFCLSVNSLFSIITLLGFFFLLIAQFNTLLRLF